MSENRYAWMHAGEPPIAIGVDGYPVFPGDPYRELHLALNECLGAIERDDMAYLQRCWSSDPAVSGPAKEESYRERARAEEAVLRGFIVARPGEWTALFHAVLDRVLWLNSGEYAWESACEVIDDLHRQVAGQHPGLTGAMFISVALPEGESLEWQTRLICAGQTLYEYTSSEQYHGGSHIRRSDLPKILQNLLRRKVAWSADDVLRMLETIAADSFVWWMLSAPSVLRVAERHIAKQGMSAEVRDLLKRIRSRHARLLFSTAYDRKILVRVEQILATADRL